MEKIAFIGGYDKTDMLFYIAKILVTMGKKVLIVDATVPQKARYIIPTLTPTLTYITTNDNVDFGIGFDTMDKLREYMAEEGSNIEYDYIFLDIDSRKRYRGFELMPEDRHYLVTNFDIYSLKKAVEVLKGIEMKTIIKKVYFTKDLSEDEDRYLRFLTKDCNVSFEKEPIHFSLDINDMEAIQKNQRDNMIRYKPLSKNYRLGIFFLVEEISGESTGAIKRALQQIDR